MKSIIFSYSFNKDVADAACINLYNNKNYTPSQTKNTKIIVPPHGLEDIGKKYLSAFSEWLGLLNCKNHDLRWWAHTSTAKNMLSSPLGDRFLNVHLVCELLKDINESKVYVIGASPGMMESISSLLPEGEFRISGIAWKLRNLYRIKNNLSALVRILYQGIVVFMGNYSLRRNNEQVNADVCIFTYIDSVQRDGVDNYFGKLPELYNENNNILSFIYLAYVNKPFRKRMREATQKKNTTPYIFLFKFLRIYDYAWGIVYSLNELWANSYKSKYPYINSNKSYIPLLREIFVHDIAFGGYLHNLLVYGAIRRFLVASNINTLIYPYENKSLEKMLLLASRSMKSGLNITGYQHTSITPRHSTMFFCQGEAENTPLPDRIVTVGDITKKYLEENGNFPDDILVSGCALRQEWKGSASRKNRGRENINILLALSSSKKELESAVRYIRVVKESFPDIEVGVRPHPEFPLTMLSKELSDWLDKNAMDLSGTLLGKNIEWCHITAYVSSTVALETLMHGKPVIGFSIGDAISSDPVIGDAPFHWSAKDENDMVEIINYISNISDDDYDSMSDGAISYVRDYLAPIDNVCLEKLVCQP